MGNVSRRAFLTGVAATAAAAATASPSEAQAPPIPIIDTHIHLFDPTRPQGAPYSGPRPAPGAAPIAAYPERYRKLAVPLGVVGAIKVEASPWIEDNLWVLEVAQRDPIMVGVVGNLEPDKPEFPAVPRAIPQEPALPRDPLWEPLGTGHHEAVHEPGLHQRPQASRRGGPRAGHGESARAAARGDAPHQRRGAERCASCSIICRRSIPRKRIAAPTTQRCRRSASARRST